MKNKKMMKDEKGARSDKYIGVIMRLSDITGTDWDQPIQDYITELVQHPDFFDAMEQVANDLNLPRSAIEQIFLEFTEILMVMNQIEKNQPATERAKTAWGIA